MGVIMQAFYWDCPRLENREQRWWDHLRAKVPDLAAAGFTALWLPPASKAASATSMGYDPYDYFDLGEFEQKGAVPTWFGTRAALEALVQAAHAAGFQVYADFVINHNSGADTQQVNPVDGQTRWTGYAPLSEKFPRDWACFHPSPYETWDEMDFGGMPDLCHRHPDVYAWLLKCASWMINEIGFDGFRYDFVKGYGGWMVRAIQELRGLRGTEAFKPFAVGECWDNDRTITEWLAEVNAFTDNPVTAFDFPLRYKLKALCDGYGFSLRGLTEGTVMAEKPDLAVTFVENHDVVRDDPVIADKMLAYAVILTHPGYPCVFWQDYFVWGLGLEGEVSGIAALVAVHERHALGEMVTRYLDDDLYIMERLGLPGRPGLIFVLNNRGSWNGAWIDTSRPNSRYEPVAWRSGWDLGRPEATTAASDGRAEFWAPPRGYAVFAPEG